MLLPILRVQVQWKTPTLAILHVGFFGVDSARRAGVMIDLRQKIWSAGGLVATAPKAKASKRGEAALERVQQRPSVEDVAEERGEGSGAGGDGIDDEEEPYSIPLMRAASEGHAAFVHSGGRGGSVGVKSGGGVGGGVGGGGSAGVRAGGDGCCPGVPRSLRSVSAALTLKEGLVHKVNAGLSGLETNIFFQLMLPRTENETTLPSAWGGAYGSLFRKDDSEEFASGRGERSAGTSRVKYVSSYLRRRRWLWSFGGSGSASFTSACDSGGAATSAAGAISGGSDAPLWSTYVQKMMHSLTRSRRADGFVLVHRGENEALMVKGVRITLGVVPAEECWKGATGVGAGGRGGDPVSGKGAPPGRGVRGEGSTGGGGGGGGVARLGGGVEAEPRTMRMLLQYKVFEVGCRRIFPTPRFRSFGDGRRKKKCYSRRKLLYRQSVGRQSV